MENRSLIQDYLTRCEHRLAAIQILLERKSWADVVRESQEVVELSLKALLMHCNIEVPRIHDVSQILIDHQMLLPKDLQKEIGRLSDISRQMRRDRELSFYGSQDLTPSEFYKKKDADQALADASWLVDVIIKRILRNA